MSIPVPCHGTTDIALERDTHTFCLEPRYIFPWEYILEILKQVSEGGMVCMKAKSCYGHLFRNIFHSVRSKYCCSLTTHSCGWTVCIPPRVIPHVACLFSQREWVAAGSSVQNAVLVFHWTDCLIQMERQLTYFLWSNLRRGFAVH